MTLYQPPTIAHEGNPRETEDLVVAGVLDGAAVLLAQTPPTYAQSYLSPDEVKRPLPSDV